MTKKKNESEKANVFSGDVEEDGIESFYANRKVRGRFGGALINESHPDFKLFYALCGYFQCLW